MEKMPSRRDVLRGLSLGVLAASGLVASGKPASAMRELDTRDLDPDTTRKQRELADKLEAIEIQQQEALRRGDTERAKELQKILEETITRNAKKLLPR